MRSNRHSLAVCGLTVALLAACGGDAGDAGSSALTGAVSIDGSSTVFPIAEAVAEEFQIANPDVRVTVGFSGSGGGFKRFCAGETDVSDASRPINEQETATCAAAGIDFTEVTVAWDGLSVIVNPANDFVTCLTTQELRRIWEPGSTVSTWSDVRPEWPDEEINLYGPGTDSGTFDYFTETINGESGASRPDFQASEDDNILVQGVAGDEYALGYFGYAYYVENSDRLKLVQVDGGTGCVAPSDDRGRNVRAALTAALRVREARCAHAARGLRLHHLPSRRGADAGPDDGIPRAVAGGVRRRHGHHAGGGRPSRLSRPDPVRG
jgi:phosphate transport system substrate-binding protein